MPCGQRRRKPPHPPLARRVLSGLQRAISETQGYFNKVKSDLAADQGGATGAMQK